MTYLLDTHMLLWWQANDKALPNAARTLIADPQNDIFVSALTLWEIIIKTAKGKLEADILEIRQAIQDDAFQVLPFTEQHTLEVRNLPLIHQDPFDRGLIATARHEGMMLLTVDDILEGYGSSVQKI
jgi:PIN domain nuclease of toxin-antitoxin system